MPQTYTVGARSLFVTLTAWLFIALGACTALTAAAQNALLAALLPGELVAFLARSQPLPWLSALLLEHLPWVLGAGMVLALATLTSAVGLLQRMEWARRIFIGLLLLAILGNLMGLWLQQEVVQSVVQATLQRTPLPPQAADVLGGLVTAARGMGLAVTLAVCVSLAWIIRHLMSPMVRQEFA
jgi:hypothetical protein